MTRPHMPWCEHQRDEGHAACSAYLGTVIQGDDRHEVRISRCTDTEPVVTLTLNGVTDRTVALKGPRAAELAALLAQGSTLAAQSVAGSR